MSSLLRFLQDIVAALASTTIRQPIEKAALIWS